MLELVLKGLSRMGLTNAMEQGQGSHTERTGIQHVMNQASVHTAHIIRNLPEDIGVEVMVLPPYSPDLNPNENLWAVMEGKIY
jgi:transposase